MAIPFVPILAVVGGIAIAAELLKAVKGLFGSGDHVDQRSAAPPPPQLPPGTNIPGEDQRNRDNTDEHHRIDGHAGDGNTTQQHAEGNSADGRDKLDQILAQLQQIAGRNNAAGATPETETANDQAIRDALKQLRDTVGGADAANRGLAAGLPMLGGLPGMGGMMPALGGLNPLGGGGMPGTGLGTLNPLTGDHHVGPEPTPLSPLTADHNASAAPLSPLTGPQLTNGMDHPGAPADHGSNQAAALAGPDHHDTPQPGDTVNTQVTAADGTKTTAPNQTVAAALRAAIANPGATNQAAAAYAAAGVQLPADGADPGQAVPTGAIQPGDIARWDDPPRDLLVFGDGKIVDSTGKLEDLKTALASGVFNGFFRPKTSAAPAPVAAAPGPVPHNADT